MNSPNLQLDNRQQRIFKYRYVLGVYLDFKGGVRNKCFLGILYFKGGVRNKYFRSIFIF